MINQYNLYNLEASFRNYLLAGNISLISLKNYLSDFRHFIGWLLFNLESEKISLQDSTDTIIFLLTQERIEAYKNYLVENKIPQKTSNRRLSTVRKFCSFCISQGWLKENPAKIVQNVTSIKQIRLGTIIEELKNDLNKQKADPVFVKDTLNDIQEFVDFTLIEP